VYKRQQDWTITLLDELFQFPDPLTHDDAIDSLAYIDQLAIVNYNAFDFEDDYEPLDYASGY
jgi:phage terminase large subunit-like protein